MAFIEKNAERVPMLVVITTPTLPCGEPRLVCLQALKECFDKKDIALLQKLILEIPKEEAELHMKRCIDSGLWLPDGGAGEEAEEGREGDEEGEGEAAGAAAREEK